MLDPDVDIEVGHAAWNKSTQLFELDFTSGKTPLNLVRVKPRLAQFDMSGDGSSVDSRIPLFFAHFFGHDTANTHAAAAAAVLPGVGFRVLTDSNKRSGILPFAFDETTWLAMIAGTGPDKYSYSAATKHKFGIRCKEQSLFCFEKE